MTATSFDKNFLRIWFVRDPLSIRAQCCPALLVSHLDFHGGHGATGMQVEIEPWNSVTIAGRVSRSIMIVCASDSTLDLIANTVLAIVALHAQSQCASNSTMMQGRRDLLEAMDERCGTLVAAQIDVVHNATLRFTSGLLERKK